VKTLLMLAAIAVLTFIVGGCAVGIAGARVSMPMPGSRPVLVYDSTGVNAKNGTDNGAQLGKGGLGDPGTSTDGTRQGIADQAITAGGDLANARSTDTGLAKGQSVVGGRETGEVNAAGPRDQDKSLKIPVNVSPGSGANATVNANRTPELIPPDPE